MAKNVQSEAENLLITLNGLIKVLNQQRAEIDKNAQAAAKYDEAVQRLKVDSAGLASAMTVSQTNVTGGIVSEKDIKILEEYRIALGKLYAEGQKIKKEFDLSDTVKKASSRTNKKVTDAVEQVKKEAATEPKIKQRQEIPEDEWDAFLKKKMGQYKNLQQFTKLTEDELRKQTTLILNNNNIFKISKIRTGDTTPPQTEEDFFDVEGSAYSSAKAKYDKILGTPSDKDAVNKQRAGESRAYQEYLAELNRRKREELINIIPGGETTVGKLEQDAAKRGFTPENLHSIRQMADTGVTSVKYQTKTLEGVTRDVEYAVSKTGDFLVKTNRRLQDFGTAVGRNVIEFARWSIAVSLILVPLQKLSEISAAVVQQQDKLVNTMIALSNSQRNVNTVYAEAYKVSQKVSEEIGNVIDAFTLAYRATGGMADAEERFVTASKLLTDALTLSKLAGIDEATAIDTLTASLKQMNEPLSKGTDLLDKWVKATQIANVDLNSLATSFAVAGDASDKIGISTDNLIGIISTLGETGIASGRELANMTKAIVSGFQSDQAQKTLQSFGVSLQDATGDARGFMDIMNQISQMQQQGLLTPEQYSELTLKLGGGTRRQAVWSTFIENFNRVNQVATGVMNSQGTAADALAKKQETVVSATTRLNNALMNLGTTLGTKGGILDVVTLLLEGLRGIADILNVIFNLTGKVTPLLLLVGGIAAVTGKQSPEKRQLKSAMRFDSLVNTFTKVGFARNSPEDISSNLYGNPDYYGLNYNPPTTTSRFGAYELANTLTRKPLIKSMPSTTVINMAGALAIPAISAVQNFTDKDANKYNRQARGAADIVGGALGLAVGAFAGNPMLGAAIGTSISEAFVNATIADETSFEDFFKKTVAKGASKQEKEATESIDKRIEEASQQAKRDMGGGSGVIGTLIARQGMAWENLLGGKNAPKYETLKQYVYANTSPEARAELDKLKAEKTPQAIYEQDTFVALEKDIQTRYADLLKSLSDITQKELMNKLISGEITKSEYDKALKASQNYNLTATAPYAVMGAEYEKLTGKSTEQAMKDFAKVATYASEEQNNAVSALVGKIQALREEMTTLATGSFAYNQVQTELNQVITNAVTLFEQLNGQIASQVKLRETASLEQYTPEMLKQAGVEQYGGELFLRQKQAAGATEEEAKAMQKSLPGFTPYFGGGIYGAPIGKGITDQASYMQALELLQGQGKISQLPNQEDIIFKKLSNVSEAQLQTILNEYYPQLAKSVQRYGYKLNEEPAVVGTETGISGLYTKDWKLVEFLLSRILDTEQKQLETSIYNFPEGMQAYVPFSGYQAGFGNGAGGGGGTDIEGFLAGIDQILLKYFPPKDATSYKEPSPEVSTAAGKAPTMDTAAKQAMMESFTPKETLAQTTGNIVELGVDKFNEWLNGFIKIFTDLGKNGSPAIPETIPKGATGSLVPNTAQNAALASYGDTKPIQTKLTMDIKNNLTITLDGKVLAALLSRYLGNSIARYGTAGGTTTRMSIM